MRGLPILIIVLLLLIGGAWFLQSRVKQQPVHTIETNVTANAG